MSKTDETPERPRCSATTLAGTPCRKYAIDGSEKCAHHSYAVPGRPSKLTAELTAQIVDVVLEGNYRETAAQMIGVSKRTLYNWIAIGEEHIDTDKPPAKVALHVEFVHALKSAEAYAEALLLRRASTGGFGWQAPMTVLERKYPDRWGRRDTTKVEHTGTVKHDLRAMSDSDLQQIADGLDSKRSAS